MSVHVSSWVWKNSKSRGGDRLVMLAIADMADDDRAAAWPSKETLASRAGLSERQVIRCVKNLIELGELSEIGSTRHGTKIYSVVGYLGGDTMSPRGDADVRVGVTSRHADPDTGVTRIVSEPSLEPSQAARATSNVVELRSNSPSWKVDRKQVTGSEEGLARAVLSSWNEQTGQSLTSKDWLGKIVMRVREYPDWNLQAHEHVIAAALADPWWKGAPSPSVVYGNGAAFERSVEQAKRGSRPGDDKPARFGRGLSTRQIGEWFGGAA